MVDEADRIWNRAALFWETDDRDRLSGDLALKALLLAHGLIMNGGVAHCHDAMSPEEVSQAVEGYRWFGLDQAAELVESTGNAVRNGSMDEQASLAADDAYNQAIPDDRVIETVFRAKFGAARDAFAPVSIA